MQYRSRYNIFNSFGNIPDNFAFIFYKDIYMKYLILYYKFIYILDLARIYVHWVSSQTSQCYNDIFKYSTGSILIIAISILSIIADTIIYHFSINVLNLYARYKLYRELCMKLLLGLFLRTCVHYHCCPSLQIVYCISVFSNVIIFIYYNSNNIFILYVPVVLVFTRDDLNNKTNTNN